MNNADPYNLDWGTFTPEGYNSKENEVLHVFNFDISSNEKIARCIVFSAGKIVWAGMQIPKGTKQKVVFDLRGQPITFLDRFRKMKKSILKGIENKVEVASVTIETII